MNQRDTVPNFRAMTPTEIAETCGTDPHLWATAIVQTGEQGGLSDDNLNHTRAILTDWLGRAMEAARAAYERTLRARLVEAQRAGGLAKVVDSDDAGSVVNDHRVLNEDDPEVPGAQLGRHQVETTIELDLSKVDLPTRTVLQFFEHADLAMPEPERQVWVQYWTIAYWTVASTRATPMRTNALNYLVLARDSAVRALRDQVTPPIGVQRPRVQGT